MINIRREQPADYAAIYELVKQAFEHAEHTNHDEHNLVNHLRQSPFYLPELALVAETGGIIVGHIMFTETRVGDSRQLLLAPLSVLPQKSSAMNIVFWSGMPAIIRVSAMSAPQP